MVRTTNRSMDAIPAAWLRRNVFQPWEGGPFLLVMYLATVDWATSIPSISSLPCIRGAPHSEFSLLIRRMRSQISHNVWPEPWDGETAFRIQFMHTLERGR